MRIRDYTVFDLEMTGLSAEDNKIIEIGAVRVRDGKMTDTYSTLVNPHVSISPIVVKLTGITDAMLSAGIEEDLAIPRLIEFIGADVVVGHSVAYDFRFIRQWAVNHRIPLELWSCDTLKLAKELVPGDQPKKLEALCKFFSIERVHAHRALDDSIETWQLYEILADMAEQADRTELLEPVLLKDGGKRRTPATGRQKQRLKEYMKRHGIQESISWDTLTRSQASRKMDKYRARYGKYDMQRKQDKNRVYNKDRRLDRKG